MNTNMALVGTTIRFNESPNGVQNNQSSVAKPDETNPETGDKFSIGETLEKIGDTVGKVTAGTVNGLMYGAYKAYEGASDAALKAVSNDYPNMNDLEKSFIKASTIGGAILGGTLAGPAGVAIGGLAGPGFAGGAFETTKGMRKGISDGYTFSKELGKANEDKVTGALGDSKLSKLAGKAANLATTIVAGAITIPVLALCKGINAGVEYGFREAGSNDENNNYVDGTFPERVAVGGSAIKAALSNSPGLMSSAIDIGVSSPATLVTLGAVDMIGTVSYPGSVAGAAGSTVAGLKSGIKGFEEGYQKGVKIWNEADSNISNSTAGQTNPSQI